MDFEAENTHFRMMMRGRGSTKTLDIVHFYRYTEYMRSLRVMPKVSKFQDGSMKVPVCVCVSNNRIAIHFSRQFGYTLSIRAWTCNKTFIALDTLAYRSHKQIHQNKNHSVSCVCSPTLSLSRIHTHNLFRWYWSVKMCS